MLIVATQFYILIYRGFLTHLSPLHKRGCFFGGSQKGTKKAETLVSISAAAKYLIVVGTPFKNID